MNPFFFLLTTVCLILSTSITTFAQAKYPSAADITGAESSYDDFIGNFQRRANDAVWLLGYDRIAWASSDSVMNEPDSIKARLGTEWFCYQDDNTQVWHIFFGKLDTATLHYQAVIHYTINPEGHFERSKITPDPQLCDGFGRAIFYANYLLAQHTPAVELHMNQYARLRDDTIEVWFLPAILPDYTLPFGGEFMYSFDKSGQKMIKSDIKYDKFYGVKPDTTRKIRLDYRQYAEPTVGSIFFVLQNYMQFKQILIETQWGVSGLIHSNDSEPAWVHLPQSELPKSFSEDKGKNKKKNKTKKSKIKKNTKT